jgi:hypothetical protein
MYRSDYQLKIFLQIGNASVLMTDCARSQVYLSSLQIKFIQNLWYSETKRQHVQMVC